MSLVHFQIVFFVFQPMSFKSSPSFLGNSPLSNMRFADIFSHLVAYLSVFLTGSFPEQNFIFQ